MYSKSYLRLAQWRRRTKFKLIAYKGGKCIRCGYDKIQYPRAFDFHHRDPKQKEMTLSLKRARSWKALLVEVDKCDLLCCRCHREIHDELFDEQLQIRTAQIKERLFLSNIVCPGCSNVFKPLKSKQKACSTRCTQLLRRKVKRPSKDQLKMELRLSNYVQVAKKYGVTDNAIRKWLR